MASERPLLRVVAIDEPPPGVPAAVPDADALYQQHWRHVGRVALRLLGRNDEVEDVVQDVFVSAIRSLHTIKDGNAVKSWLTRITVRRVADRLAWRRLKRMVLWDSTDLALVPTPEAGPEVAAEVSQLYRRLDQLPAAERIAWILRHVEEERLEDVAGLCGCSLATAKRRIAAAQVKLSRFEGKGGTA